MYCLTRGTLKYNNLILKICMFPQKKTSNYKKSFPRDPSSMFLATTFTRKMSESSDCMYSLFCMLENIWHYHFTWSEPTEFARNCEFCSNLGSPETLLNFNKFTTSCKFGPLGGIHGTWAFWHFVSKNGHQKESAWIHGDPFYAYEG